MELEHRRALYALLAPSRLDAPGRGWQAFADWDWDACIHGGLTDEDALIRQGAAAMAFGTRRGHRFAATLLDNLQRAAGGEKWAILLALGGADDAGSLEALRRATADADAGISTAAVRALGARRDGHAELVTALLGPAGAVRDAAVFALAHVTEALAADDLARLDAAAATTPGLPGALEGYRRRHTGRG